MDKENLKLLTPENINIIRYFKEYNNTVVTPTALCIILVHVIPPIPKETEGTLDKRIKLLRNLLENKILSYDSVEDKFSLTKKGKQVFGAILL